MIWPSPALKIRSRLWCRNLHRMPWKTKVAGALAPLGDHQIAVRPAPPAARAAECNRDAVQPRFSDALILIKGIGSKSRQTWQWAEVRSPVPGGDMKQNIPGTIM